MAAGHAGAPSHETVDGINVVRLGGIHALWLTTFIYYMRKCRRRYDVVVAEGFGGSRIPRFAPLYVRAPIITEWHQIHRDLFARQYPKMLNGPLNLLERIAAAVSRNTLVRVGTEEWRRAFPKIGFKPENLFVVPVSIRDEWLENRRNDRNAEPVVLWLGKLRRYKCPDHVIRAMVDVSRRVPNAKLILAIRRDDVAYENELRALVRQLHLEKNVEFHLNVSEQEKRRLLNSAAVLAVTSAVEGFGIVVLEANACGVPVVASTGVPEGAVRDGVNGLRYRFGDTDALGEAISRVLEDSDLHSRLSRNALTSVERFRWSRVGAEFERVVVAAARNEKVGVRQN